MDVVGFLFISIGVPRRELSRHDEDPLVSGEATTIDEALMDFDADTDAWELENAEVRARNSPALYSVPSLDELSRLQAGDRAQLLFLFRGRDEHGAFIQDERLWVRVEGRAGAGFSGMLEAGPVCSELLRVGDAICFEWFRIARIEFASQGG